MKFRIVSNKIYYFFFRELEPELDLPELDLPEELEREDPPRETVPFDRDVPDLLETVPRELPEELERVVLLFVIPVGILRVFGCCRAFLVTIGRPVRGL